MLKFVESLTAKWKAYTAEVRQAQDDFNKKAEEYVAQNGIVAFEQHMKNRR